MGRRRTAVRNEDAITFGDAELASLQEEVPGAGSVPGLAGFRNSKVFSTDRNLPGVVTALPVFRSRITAGGRSLPEA